MERIVESKEIYRILAIYVYVQIAAIILAYYAPHLHGVPLTVSEIAQGAGIPNWEIAVIYGVWIALSGTVIWFIIKNWNYRDLFIRLAEGFFIIAGTSSIFLLLLPSIGLAAYLPGIALAIVKNVLPWLRNTACIISSIGVGLLLGSQFGFPVLLLLMIIIAVYDYIAVNITKHMVAMAQAYGNLNLALMVTVFRKTGAKTYSSLTLGGGDLIFPAALSSSLVLAVPSPLSIGLALALVVGGASALGYLTYKIRATHKAYPAIPYLFGGMLLAGAFFVLVLLL